MTSRLLSLFPAAVAATIAVAAVDAQQPVAKPMLIRASKLLDVRAGAYRASQGIWIDDALSRVNRPASSLSAPS
jgi:hypothetical protein